MKTALLKTTILMSLIAMLSACSGGNKLNSSSDGGNNPIVTPPDDDGTETPTTPTTTWPFTVGGDTTTFYPVSWEEMNTYVGERPLNNPTNPMVNVDIKPVTGYNILHGTVRIGYTDNGQFRYGEFTVGDGKNTKCKRCKDNDTYDAAYNYWTTINGIQTFVGFFQDQWGSIILVLEKGTTSSPDAEGSQVLNGRIFYRNFAANLYDQSAMRSCWYIYSGPYACYSHAMANKSSSTSFDGYRQLGSFQGLKSYKAIGQ